MKPSKYIKKIAFINIKKKKQRTWLSLISIGLSTAIIYTSFTLFVNIYHLSKDTDYTQIGSYHYAAMVENDVSSTRYDSTYDYDSNLYANNASNLLNVRSLQFDDTNLVLPFSMKEGKIPTSNQEIIVSDDSNYHIGQNIQLDLGFLHDTHTEHNLYQFPTNVNEVLLNRITPYTFKVVGIYYNNDDFRKLTNNHTIYYTTNMNNGNRVVYLKDENINSPDSFSYVSQRLNIDAVDIYANEQAITKDTVKSYLKDTTTLLIMFIIIASIAIAMSLISVHNVVLISDKDRKKELGLLKSIGATPLEIKKLVTLELGVLGFLGAIIGIFIGIGISYLVLQLFIERLYINFDLSMILNPLVLFISFIIGTCLMLAAGFKAYNQYFYSTPISDLKNFSYDYEPPAPKQKGKRRSFEWQMFIIYNGRMKKQTKNIFRSFFLLLFTTVLFMAILFSNIMYRNQYIESNSDLELMNYSNNGIVIPDENVISDIYKASNDGRMPTQSLFVSRLISSFGTFYSPEDIFNTDLLNSYKSTSRIGYSTIDVEQDGSTQKFNDIATYNLALDTTQIEELKPYVVEGSLDNLTSTDIIGIFNDKDRLSYQLYQNMNVGTEIRVGNSEQNRPLNIACIVVLPENAISSLHFDYENFPRVYGMSLEALKQNSLASGLIERVHITLLNRSMASSSMDVIDDILNEHDVQKYYTCENYALTVETNRFSSFIIEALLYPLFFMLFIVSIMNINNVFVGNVHLKRSDISIMKSIGMNNFQLKMLFVFEYLEGYINASLLVTAIFIPICIIESIFGLASAFKLGDNIFGTLIVSICLLGFLMVIPLMVLTLRKITKILPIENIKDLD